MHLKWRLFSACVMGPVVMLAATKLGTESDCSRDQARVHSSVAHISFGLPKGLHLEVSDSVLEIWQDTISPRPVLLAAMVFPLRGQDEGVLNRQIEQGEGSGVESPECFATDCRTIVGRSWEVRHAGGKKVFLTFQFERPDTSPRTAPWLLVHTGVWRMARHGTSLSSGVLQA